MSLPESSSFLTEDLQQLQTELKRFGDTRPMTKGMRRASDEMLHFRIEWLIEDFERNMGASAWVSVLEYQRFLDETGSLASHLPLVDRERKVTDPREWLRPAVGIPRQGAESFCRWLSAYSERAEEPVRARLPKWNEAQSPIKDAAPTPELAALFEGKGIGSWCSDSPILACADPPAWSRGLAKPLLRQLRLDHWFLFVLGLYFYRHATVPVRKTDWDFNENYMSDRRFMESYASHLSRARRALIELDHSRNLNLGIANILTFEPLRDLASASPLDRYRDKTLEVYSSACEAIIHSPATDDTLNLSMLPFADHRWSLPIGAEEELERATESIVSRGIDLALINDRLRQAELDAHDPRSPIDMRHFLSPLIGGIGHLGQNLSRDAVIDARWDTLQHWMANRDVEPPRPGWLSRLLGQGANLAKKKPPRATLSSVYCDLSVLGLRLGDHLPAFEGIRLVHDAESSGA